MFARSISPTGALSVLNLSLLPIWRLCLVANPPGDLGIALQYPNPQGKISLMMLAALGCLTQFDDVQNVAKVGFPKETLSANKERLLEAMKILLQSELTEGMASNLIAKSTGLVDIYYESLQALRTGADASGCYEGWKWIVSREETGWKIPVKEEKKDAD